ncbi:MAG: hypothetical protein R2689_06040 [Microthrixaceae bacterium]
MDAVRPVTFGYLPVYVEPADEAGWNALGSALAVAGALGVDRYEAVRDDLVQRVIDAKLRKLAVLDPAACTVADWNAATSLDLLSFHDTMNHTARPDGAICLERAAADRLPSVVALSNRGGSDGSVRELDDDGLRSDDAVPSMRPRRLWAIADAYRTVFDAWGDDEVAFNRPYLGGYETTTAGPLFRAFEPRCVVRRPGHEPRRLRLGAFQNEFRREFLLGEHATAQLMQPGTDWVEPPEERVQWLAERLRDAHQLVRTGRTARR